MKVEKEIPLEKLIEHLDNLEGAERIAAEEIIYKRQQIRNQYSVKGNEYKSKYDTGEEI